MSIMTNFAAGFAACAHKDQKRKYTGGPYIDHCFDVAARVAQCSGRDDEMIAAAYLHDTVEDTSVTKDDLIAAFGQRVADLVMEVTDVSKPEDGNRAERKKIDMLHLSRSSPRGATIKLADLISNTSTIVEYDPDFARVYLQEKSALLPLLKHGDSKLFYLALKTLQWGEEKLVQQSLSRMQEPE